MAIVSGWDRGTWNQGAWNTEIPVEITGVSAAASAGSVTIAFITNVTGVSAAAGVGSPTLITNSLLTPAGVSAAASAGSVTYQYTVTIEGVSASATVGHPMIWTVIDPSQLARWGDISTTQTPTWTEIAA
tara:strand:- start:1617 stop:2006 length:390 start_codon:yes stop_codon:yes gene_type:complete